MLKQALRLFLSPQGRIGRRNFIIAAAIWGAFYVGQHLWFKHTGTNTFNFYLALFFMVVNIQIVFCVFGKRLHDLGRSTWALIGMLALVLVVAIFVMLNFGGLEYFDALMSDPELQNDPVAMKKIHDIYQASLAEHIPQSRTLMAILPSVFTLWLVVAKGQAGDNRYGQPPQ